MRSQMIQFVLKSMPEREVTYIVQQGSQPDQSSNMIIDLNFMPITTREFIFIEVRVDMVDHSLRNMDCTNRMLEASMHSARKHDVCEPKLPYSP